ncbi:MAG TPA: hypothetical protein VE710_08120 [Candidatus Bathyarchaeia archaeon]|nr:hypothetical protein [Candidatus Bathyarchaeia archaeon]
MNKKHVVVLLLFFYPFDLTQPPCEEGKRGMGGVFAAPAEVELPKTVHACRATSTFE